MNDLLPTVVKYRANGITVEICHNEIPDIYRLLWFYPITEFELPDTKVSDNEFDNWLGLYRYANLGFEYQLLEESQCN